MARLAVVADGVIVGGFAADDAAQAPHSHQSWTLRSAMAIAVGTSSAPGTSITSQVPPAASISACGACHEIVSDILVIRRNNDQQLYRLVELRARQRVVGFMSSHIKRPSKWVWCQRWTAHRRRGRDRSSWVSRSAAPAPERPSLDRIWAPRPVCLIVRGPSSSCA